MQKPTSSDILIIGAGLVGASLACALSNSGLTVTLLESHLLDTGQAPNVNSRPISLAYGSQQRLVQLGVWDELSKHACAIQHVHVSEKGAFGQCQFHANEFELPALGFVVPFDCLRHALYRHAIASSNTNIHCIESINAIDQDNSHATLTVTQAGINKQFTGRILVAADGNRSDCRQLLNIETTETNHHEIALTASLQLDQQLHTAYERFSKYGTLAVLPRLDRQAGMVWTMKPEQAKLAQQWSADEWIKQLQNVLGPRLGPIQSLKPTAHYPLITTTAKQQTKQRAILLGNSAHTFYPIAAQGFNLSIRDVAELARCIQQYSLDHIDRIFDNYLSTRLPDQQRVQQLISVTASLFDLQLPGSSYLRGKGLLGLASLPSLKKRLAQQTLGLRQAIADPLAELRHD